jgi:hypothetical protein
MMDRLDVVAGRIEDASSLKVVASRAGRYSLRNQTRQFEHEVRRCH